MRRGISILSVLVLALGIVEVTETPSVSASTEVGGIISTDTIWTLENSPYEITATVQIPEGVTLTIQPGVIIINTSGDDMFLLMGTMHAHGTSQQPIMVNGGGSRIIYTQPGYGYADFQYCIFENGSELWNRWGHLDLRYSELVNLGSHGDWSCSIIRLDGPSGESNIEFNRFINTAGIYSYNDSYGTNIIHNLFQGLLSPLAGMGGGTPSSPSREVMVRYNSFVDVKGLALYLEPGFIGWGPSIDAKENYWDTLDTDAIDEMIWDRNDDIRVDNYVDYLPILEEPHHDTPALPPVQYDLTIDSTAGVSVIIPGEGEFNYPARKDVDLKAVPNAGYHFVEWTGDVDEIDIATSANTFITMDDNYSITAVFALADYTLTIDSTEGGEVTVPDEGEFIYKAGTVIGLVAVADAGYRFQEWTGDTDDIDDPDAAETTITMNGDYEITANFEEIPLVDYGLTIDSTEGGEVTVPGEGEFTYPAGEEVDLKAVPNAGYHFVEWTGDVDEIDDPASSETFITMKDDCSITAVFEGVIDDPPVEEGLASISGELVIVLLWQPATQTWDLYFPLTGDDTIGTLEAGRAYWIYVDADCTLEYGTVSIPLYAGWNNPPWPAQ